jgi:mono/diheme cytochrome c family protein
MTLPVSPFSIFMVGALRMGRRSMRSVLLFFVLLSPLLAQQPRAKIDPVTAVTGESWLIHLHRPLNQTSMGDTGRWEPPAPMPGDQTAPAQPRLTSGYDSEPVLLHGEDLYRLNCRACHGEYGLGAPPEINSVINPVRATSVALITERMKRLGMDINRGEVAQLAKQSKAALILRLHNGGQDMPPFPQLRESEIRLLVGHLKQLAGVPRAAADKEEPAAPESPVRVGELIVKSTCHICHSAQGRNPSPQQLLDGAIPPLNTLTNRVSRADFVRKVTRGAAIEMGTPPLPYRGRMPVFYYLSEEEAADAYLYLTLYPPNQAVQAQAAATVEHNPNDLSPPPGTGGELMQVLPPNQGVDTKAIAYAALFSFLLLLGSIGFTVREFKRLSVTKRPRVPGRLQLYSVRVERNEY